MRTKLTVAIGVLAMALFLATSPAVVQAARQITSAQIKNSTIRSIDVRNNALTGADIKTGSVGGSDIADGSLTIDDLAPGTIPPPSAIPTVRWALVNSTHTAIVAQSGGISIAAVSGAGTYLNMGTNVSGSAISATNAYTDTDSGFRGALMATICGGPAFGGTCGVAGTNNTNHVWVFTQNSANTGGENHAFYVSVIG